MGSCTNSSAAAYFSFGGGGQKNVDKKEDKTWGDSIFGEKKMKKIDDVLGQADAAIKMLRDEKIPKLEEAAGRIEDKIDVRLDRVEDQVNKLAPIVEEAGKKIIETSEMLTRLMQVACVLAILLIIRDFMLPLISMLAAPTAELWIRFFRKKKKYRYDIDISPASKSRTSEILDY